MTPFRASAPLTQDWQHFDFAVEDGVATVTLNRPDKLNARTFEAYGELQKLEVAELLEFTRMTGAVVKALRECTLPVIAAVNGIAAGAGSVIGQALVIDGGGIQA